MKEQIASIDNHFATLQTEMVTSPKDSSNSVKQDATTTTFLVCTKHFYFFFYSTMSLSQ